MGLLVELLDVVVERVPCLAQSGLLTLLGPSLPGLSFPLENGLYLGERILRALMAGYILFVLLEFFLLLLDFNEQLLLNDLGALEVFKEPLILYLSL